MKTNPRNEMRPPSIWYLGYYLFIFLTRLRIKNYNECSVQWAMSNAKIVYSSGQKSFSISNSKEDVKTSITWSKQVTDTVCSLQPAISMQFRNL